AEGREDDAQRCCAMDPNDLAPASGHGDHAGAPAEAGTASCQHAGAESLARPQFTCSHNPTAQEASDCRRPYPGPFAHGPVPRARGAAAGGAGAPAHRRSHQDPEPGARKEHPGGGGTFACQQEGGSDYPSVPGSRRGCAAAVATLAAGTSLCEGAERLASAAGQSGGHAAPGARGQQAAGLPFAGPRSAVGWHSQDRRQSLAGEGHCCPGMEGEARCGGRGKGAAVLPADGLQSDTPCAGELTSPESLLASAILDRSIAALGMAKRRARQRMRALLQTQAQGHVPSYEPEVCKSMAVDHGVLIRLNAEDAVAEVANLLQTAWSIAAARRSATPPGGAAPALQVLTSGLRSLKRKLQAESLALGKATPPEEAAALQSLQALAQEACDEAVARASAAREAVLLPLQQESWKWRSPTARQPSQP
ncbi:unnamed protein product, partial [Effrenium voratum]